ncbi:hypothetical protein OEZ86_000410 [Tetradesmus obliquus]|nr:hypothetical protein OEZ86_000410 [Tetradesmus obliquus]
MTGAAAAASRSGTGVYIPACYLSDSVTEPDISHVDSCLAGGDNSTVQDMGISRSNSACSKAGFNINNNTSTSSSGTSSSSSSSSSRSSSHYEPAAALCYANDTSSGGKDQGSPQDAAPLRSNSSPRTQAKIAELMAAQQLQLEIQEELLQLLHLGPL